MKRCSHCRKLKPASEYFADAGSRDRLQRMCRPCLYARRAERYRFDLDFFLRLHYSQMLARTRGQTSHKGARGHAMSSRDEFLKWCSRPDVRRRLAALRETWINSGFQRKHAPSIDRIDDRQGYVLGNIRWITQSANSSRPRTKEASMSERDSDNNSPIRLVSDHYALRVPVADLSPRRYRIAVQYRLSLEDAS